MSAKTKRRVFTLENILCAIAIAGPILVLSFGFTNAVIVRLTGGY